jgi:hypothetical protein
MIQFKNILLTIGRHTIMNFEHLANIRRCRMEQEGYNTSNINWEHYAKVLYAKQKQLQD